MTGILAAPVLLQLECSAYRTGYFVGVFEVVHQRCASVRVGFNVILAEQLCVCAELVTGQLEPMEVLLALRCTLLTVISLQPTCLTSFM